MAVFNHLARPHTTPVKRDSQGNLASLGTCLGCSDPPSPQNEPATPYASLLAALPKDTQASLQEIGAGHRTEFGTCRRLQATFDRHISLLDELIGRGADHQTPGLLLGAVGICRPDGTPLPLGTISGALSRARKRAGTTRATAKPPRQPSPPPQAPAGSRGTPQGRAGPRRGVPVPAAASGVPPHPKGRGAQAQPFVRKTATPAPPTLRTSCFAFEPNQKEQP